MNNRLAPCGIDCSQCDAYIATQTGDQTLQQKLADNYKKQFGQDIAFIDLECDGCFSEGRHISFCFQCGIRRCASHYGYATCAECQDFPCESGSFIWTENSQSKANLEALRRKRNESRDD